MQYADLRFLTDPAFDRPRRYPNGAEKLVPPAADPSSIGVIDAVLLSHEHLYDNLDEAGRAFLPRARRVLTTRAAAHRLVRPA
jgi:L-ascorbate metabolism protein UlaG (beta-lactamase superfamily)